MTVKFKVHGGNPNDTFPAELEDLGLCYVSKITVEGESFYSIIDRKIAELPEGAQARVAEDTAMMRNYGWEYVAGSEEI